MALQDKLAARVQPLLEPGEQIQQVFPAQGGPSPWLASMFGALGALILASVIKWRIIAVTDRAVVLVRAGASGTSAKEVLARLPRNTRLGPVSGLWAKIRVGDENLRVHRRFHAAVNAADAAVATDDAVVA